LQFIVVASGVSSFVGQRAVKLCTKNLQFLTGGAG